MLRLAILLSVFAAPATAQDHVSDAFGILPAEALSTDRAAWAGLRDGGTFVMTKAGGAHGLLIFVGPKALVAGRDDGHAVALAFDAFGNLVQGARAGFSLEANGLIGADVRDGIADVLFWPEPVAGTFAAGVSIGDLQSPRALYLVTADLASVVPAIEPAANLEAETVSTFSSAELRDRYGNPVEDGTGTTLLLTHDDGSTTLLSAPVRETRAEATVLVRDVAAGGALDLTIATASASAEVGLDAFTGASQPDILVWSMDDIGAIGLRIGPLTTGSGYLLTDGALVEVAVTAGGETVAALGWVQDGYFETILRRPSGVASLEVAFTTALGSEQRVVTVRDTAPATIRGAE
ncbi:hypothetical protein J3R80_07090 [Aliiroseovarius sp. Z3]|uniref:hypothetical protein n=1 Tax=Aliiroseovarius sp. Z3 TaxID=2811402 RepID=UPI0023B32AC9|nr:hypothetical protein [Aliiroseovarius sp. Z3]MDE9450234.1 hypothetical protein [Aliiroseovarius sp. Z3]